MKSNSDTDFQNPSSRLFNLNINNDVVGPYTEEQLHQMVSNGQISPETLIWTEGMSNWSPYNMEFRAMAQQPAPPPVMPSASFVPPSFDLQQANAPNISYSHKQAKLKALWRVGRSSLIMWGGALFCFGFVAGFGCHQWISAPNTFSPSAEPIRKNKQARKKARNLLEEKYNITDISKREGEKGYTLLHYAAIDNNAEKASLLIEAGAEIDAMDARGVTPLARAISKSSFEVAKLLIDAGANINVGRFEGSALNRAIDERNLEGVKFALAHGVDIHKKSLNGWTYLMQAVEWAQFPDAAQLLINAGIDLDAVNQEGQTALEIARSRTGGATTVRCIAAVNAGIARKPYAKAMVESIADDNIKALKKHAKHATDELYRGKSDKCVFDIFYKGETILMHAARRGNDKLVAYMLENGADASLTTVQGVSAYQIAKENKHKNCAKLLKESNSSKSDD